MLSAFSSGPPWPPALAESGPNGSPSVHGSVLLGLSLAWVPKRVQTREVWAPSAPIRVLRVARGPSYRSDLSTNTCQQKASSGVREAILSISEAETDEEGRDHHVSQQPHLEMTAPGPQSPAVPQVHRETFANTLTHEKDKGISEAAQRRRPFWRFSRFITFAA